MALVAFLPRPESQYISQYIYWVPRKNTLKSPKWHWLILPTIGANEYMQAEERSPGTHELKQKLSPIFLSHTAICTFFCFLNVPGIFIGYF